MDNIQKKDIAISLLQFMFDIEKIFNRVSWEILFKHVDRIKFRKQLSEMIKNLYSRCKIFN